MWSWLLLTASIFALGIATCLPAIKWAYGKNQCTPDSPCSNQESTGTIILANQYGQVKIPCSKLAESQLEHLLLLGPRLTLILTDGATPSPPSKIRVVSEKDGSLELSSGLDSLWSHLNRHSSEENGELADE